MARSDHSLFMFPAINRNRRKFAPQLVCSSRVSIVAITLASLLPPVAVAFRDCSLEVEQLSSLLRLHVSEGVYFHWEYIARISGKWKGWRWHAEIQM